MGRESAGGFLLGGPVEYGGRSFTGKKEPIREKFNKKAEERRGGRSHPQGKKTWNSLWA